MTLSSARIVVTGATSLLGRDILTILAERGIKFDKIKALEAGRTAGDSVSFGDDHVLDIVSADDFAFDSRDIVLNAAPARETAALAKRATMAGAFFIDGAHVYGFDPDVPVIVPEINGDAVHRAPKKIVANPHGVAIFLALALGPLHARAKVTRVVASTYQAVSNWGRAAQDELFTQTKAMFMAHEMTAQHMPKQIAFNCYPMVGNERDDGHTDVEFQSMGQLKKILDPKIKIAINTVTVPCFVGDGMMVNVECAEEISAIKAALWMTAQQGLGVMEEDDAPIHSEITGEEFVYVARLRDDISVDNGVSFWLIGDNLRKGSALNMVQIAEKYSQK
jgi:aspartate-semialdehyde dehydrogenase